MKTRLAFLVLTVAVSAAALASPVTYTVSTVGTGSLNGTSFADQLITIVATGDTSAIYGSAPLYQVPVTATVTVEGVGSDSFTQSLSVFSYQNGSYSGAGVGRTNDADILDTGSSSFALYALTAPFGPVTGAALYNPNRPFTTVGGSFVLSDATTSTFVAQAVPEPASMAALGVGAIAVLRRRKRA